MITHLVTFSDESMSRSRDLCVDSASKHGVDKTFAFAASESQKAAGRGLGFWRWKPEIIHDFLTHTDSGLWRPDDGDILIYADAGIEFIDNVNYIIDRMDQDIFLFGNMYEHAHWCKRDIVEAIFPPADDAVRPDIEVPDYYQWSGWARFGKQVQASVIFFRVNDKTRSFVAEWLKWCLDGYTDSFPPYETRYLIDDSPSFTPNHPEFQENRHDQAILTTMAYRDGYILHWWPAVYNDGAFIYPRGEYPDIGIPALFHHHRKRNHEWPAPDRTYDTGGVLDGLGLRQ